MLRTCMPSSGNLMPILVLMLLHFCYRQGQKIEDCRRFVGYNCVKFADCPQGAEFVRNKIATLCGFDNGVAKICCPRPLPPYSSAPTFITRSTTTTTATTTTARSPIKLTPITPRITSVTPSRRPPYGPVTVRPAQKNATAIVIANCRKYEKYQYVMKRLDPLIPGDEVQFYQELDCVQLKTLIVGGVPVDAKEYPHMALIGYGNNFRNVEWACGGSLISEKFVMSAAHCGTSELGEAKWVLLGELNITSAKERPADSVKPKVYSIVRRFNHPNYKPPSVYNDISLFELNATVEMSPFVRPACLHTIAYHRADPSVDISITGWGLTGAAERRSSQLLKSRIRFQEEDICVSEYSTSSRLDHGYEPSSMVCAGDLISGNDTCPGDSGGPLQIQEPNTTCMWSIVGITSIGPGICGNLETPGIYTKVAHYLDWIQGIVWP